eukprot:scaffold6052_cov154-Pinguiococcus_pyrenoidosus.AAC.2
MALPEEIVGASLRRLSPRRVSKAARWVDRPPFVSYLRHHGHHGLLRQQRYREPERGHSAPLHLRQPLHLFHPSRPHRIFAPAHTPYARDSTRPSARASQSNPANAAELGRGRRAGKSSAGTATKQPRSSLNSETGSQGAERAGLERYEDGAAEKRARHAGQRSMLNSAKIECGWAKSANRE